LACGLPALYLNQGSHAELVKAAGIGFNGEDEMIKKLDELVKGWLHYRRKIRITSMNEIAQQYLALKTTINDQT
jgi:hypothetical protein